MVEIGAGGGSIARVDRLKRITVGPDSAGADPGPACYGRGGAVPTVTDADLCSAASTRPGFPAAAWRSTAQRRRAARSARGGRAARSGAVELAALRGQRDRRREHGQRRPRPRDRERQGCARPHPRRVWRRGAAARRAARRKARPRPGAGAVERRGRLGGRLSARADRLRDRALAIAAARCLRRRARPTRCLAAMRAEAEAIVRRGAPDAPLAETRSAFMRYRGQGHEIAVPLPVRHLSRRGRRCPARRRSRRPIAALYSRVIPGVEVEVLSWVLLLSGPGAARGRRPAAVAAALRTRRRRAAARCSIPTTANSSRSRSTSAPRSRPGAVIPGPAIIVEDETSTVVSRLFTATIDAFGYINLNRREG